MNGSSPELDDNPSFWLLKKPQMQGARKRWPLMYAKYMSILALSPHRGR
jgi:hypothetical protein